MDEREFPHSFFFNSLNTTNSSEILLNNNTQLLEDTFDTEGSTIFFSLSLSLFAVAGVVIFVKTCVRCPSQNSDHLQSQHSFHHNRLGPDGRPLNFIDDSYSGQSLDDHDILYDSKHAIPYDYANIDDYKFVQTPTTPTPASTPGLGERKSGGKFNPQHFAHLAGLKFRKDSCGSCQKSLNRYGRDNLPKDFRYFCRKCRMLHRFNDSVDRSCVNLDGSTASCLDRKAFYYTPTHIHLAIISSKTYRPTKELFSFKSKQPFKLGSLHDTKSESNLARSKYCSSSRTNPNSSHADIFSPNPRRKISDIVCGGYSSAEAKYGPRSPLSSVYIPEDSHQQRHSRGQYQSMMSHELSPTSINYPSSCSLYSQKDANLSGSRFFVYPEETHRSPYLTDSDVVLSAEPFMSSKRRSKALTENVYPSCSSERSLPPLGSYHAPVSPRLLDTDIETSGCSIHGQSARYPFVNSSYSFDVYPQDSAQGSLASSFSSVQYSPKSIQRLRQNSLHSGDQVFMSHESLNGAQQFGLISEQCEPSAQQQEWYSMTSVNMEDPLEYDMEEEDEEDEITVAEFKKPVSTLEPSFRSILKRTNSHGNSQAELHRSKGDLNLFPTSP